MNEKVHSNNPELAKVEAIIDETIRPALQMHGGNLQTVSLDGNVLTIRYQGACGGCPSAAFGTLSMVENILREKYSPDITVKMA